MSSKTEQFYINEKSENEEEVEEEEISTVRALQVTMEDLGVLAVKEAEGLGDVEGDLDPELPAHPCLSHFLHMIV